MIEEAKYTTLPEGKGWNNTDFQLILKDGLELILYINCFVCVMYTSLNT